MVYLDFTLEQEESFEESSDSTSYDSESTGETESVYQPDEYESTEGSIIFDNDEEILNHIDWMDMLDPIPMIHGNYYIGCYTDLQYDNKVLLFVNKIHPKTFMEFDGIYLSKYFFWYSGIALPKLPPIDILELHIDEYDTYTVVVKTFWIKIIQRAWKRVFKQRQEFIEYKKRLWTIREYEYSPLNSQNTLRYGSLKGLLV